MTADSPGAVPIGRSAWLRNIAANLRHDRLLGLVLVLIIGLTVVNLVWLPFSTVNANPLLFFYQALASLPFLVLWLLLGAMRYQLRKTPFLYREAVAQFSVRAQGLLVALGQIILLSAGLLLLSYLASATGRPLMDRYLAAADGALGFDWVDYVTGLNAHPIFAHAITYAYGSLKIQMLVLPAILAFTSRLDRLAEFSAHFGLAGCLTCVVLVGIPAAGASDFFHPSPEVLSSFGAGASTRHLDQLHTLRTLKPFLIEHPEGLVTFPSFHSALAAIFVYSMRDVRYIAPPVFLLNVMLILATPPQGGHYLVDVLAGLAIAIVAIQSVRWIARGRGAVRSSGGRLC
ncbi:phosphatase PAP2 family protein [Mesorhizobium sp. M0488]|uniref:phosphatase PAP2 family protein n=1 Tax=unclassified Mesorhizobium TaxID=325217 RepID=UPI00333D8358